MNSAICPNCNKEFTYEISDCYMRRTYSIANQPSLCVSHYKKRCPHCRIELYMKNGGQEENNGKWFILPNEIIK